MNKIKLRRHCEQERLDGVAERSNLIIEEDCFGSHSPTQPRNDVKVKIII